MRRHIESKGTRIPFVWGNLQATHEWFEVLRRLGSGLELDNESLTWIEDLMVEDPDQRPDAWELTTKIRDAASSRDFIGQCCAKDDGTEDAQSSANSEECRSDRMEELVPLAPGIDDKPFRPYLEPYLEPSSQHSVEEWLDFSHSFVPNEPSQETLTSEIDSSCNERNIDEGVEYEIEQDSDGEETNSGSHEYNIAPESSGSETTPHASTLVPQSPQDLPLGPQTVVGEDIAGESSGSETTPHASPLVPQSPQELPLGSQTDVGEDLKLLPMNPVLEFPELPSPATSVPSERLSRPIEDTSAQTVAQNVDSKVDLEQGLSGASADSVGSISAAVRTPDQIRTASGLSQRRTRTPKLRRVDHSVSNDLRLAHKLSEATNLAKSFEAEDKGKGRVREMGDIYISDDRSRINVT